MTVLTKLRSPKNLFRLGLLVLVAVIGCFAYNRYLDNAPIRARGEILTAALQEVDVTVQPFRASFAEYVQLDPVTEADLSAEARAGVQNFIEEMRFSVEKTKKYDAGEYDRINGGSSYYLGIICSDTRTISLGDINDIIHVGLYENGQLIEEGAFWCSAPLFKFFEQ